MLEASGIRRKSRKLTRFLCQEMLYDYMIGNLDNARKKAVEEFLAENPEMQSELKEMAEAVRYCQKLSETKLSEELVESLSQVRLASEVVAEKVAYRNWPDLLKWSTEATIISVCVAGIAMVVPWASIRNVFSRPPSDQVVLADVDKKIREKDVKAPAIEVKEVVPVAPTEPTVPVISTPPVVPLAPVAVIAPAVAKPTPTAAPARVVIAKTEVEKPSPLDGKRAQPKGLLYRIMMTDARIRSAAPGLATKILSLGGKKAGQVEIGWRKSNGNYFHFALPEKEYQNLITTLGAYGPVRIYKSPHERVMPQGTIRIILWIEDAPGSSDDSEVPSGSSDITVPEGTGASEESPTPESSSEAEQ